MNHRSCGGGRALARIAAPAARRLRTSRGFTLVELMISVTISLIVLSAISYVFANTRTAHRLTDNAARVQESGRFALDYVAQDLRMAGFAGCGSRMFDAGTTLVIARPAIGYTGVDAAIAGFEDGAGWINPSGVARLRGDVLTVRRAVGGGTEIAANTDAAAATVTIKDNCAGFRRSDYALIASCERAALFRVTNDVAPTCTGAVTPVVLEHQASGAGPSGADGNGNNGVVAGAASHQIADVFAADTRATVFRFEEVSYFIGANPAGRPGLYRTASNAGTEELVDNVEDMDIVFGVDTSVPADGVADEYRRADGVANWGQVVSVRINLLTVSPDAAVAASGQTYALRDDDGDGVADVQTAPDSRLRQVFGATVALRNRVL